MDNVRIADELKLPIFEFICNAHTIPNLIAVILFGSVVTGDLSKKSDIDVLLIFETDHNPEVGKEARTAHELATVISNKFDLHYPFSFVFLNKKNMSEIEPDFLWEIAKNGIVLWGKPQDVIMEMEHPSLEPLLLIHYSLKSLDEKQKRKILRWIYTAKKKIIDKKKEKMGPGVLLIEAKKFEELKHIFDKFSVQYSFRKIWGH